MPVHAGDSVAVNGCCLTATSDASETLAFDLMAETLSRTNLGNLALGQPVNLEPALRLGDPLGGHWVQGHVDAVGTISAVDETAEGLDLQVQAPPQVLRYCIERGSITIDGVALTIMRLDGHSIGVSLIPETRERTTLGARTVGDRVNLEADLLGKYVERLLASRLA